MNFRIDSMEKKSNDFALQTEIFRLYYAHKSHRRPDGPIWHCLLLAHGQVGSAVFTRMKTHMGDCSEWRRRGWGAPSVLRGTVMPSVSFSYGFRFAGGSKTSVSSEETEELGVWPVIGKKGLAIVQMAALNGCRLLTLALLHGTNRNDLIKGG
ncbi:MAG: hypothetical protein LIP11_01010 [Clostridiales bacterium]|nr:hypothetical protein [Clostridiales bacterium]